MADRPILFSAPMVAALLAGTKTQTRRLLRNPEYYGCPTGDCPHQTQAECDAAMGALTAKETRFAPGDRLWVQEAWSTERRHDRRKPTDLWQTIAIYMHADRQWFWPKNRVRKNLRDDQSFGESRPAMHMLRWASRLTLTVTDVRVQRLQNICEDDAIAEGIEARGFGSMWGWIDYLETNPHMTRYYSDPRESYRTLWDSLHTDPGTRWADSPWVVAVAFDVARGNIDGEADA